MNLYECLEVNKDATQDDIKSSYRRLSRLHHPDTGDGNVESLLLIKEAYEVLSNPENRKRYDVALKITECQDEEKSINNSPSIINVGVSWSGFTSGSSFSVLTGGSIGPTIIQGVAINQRVNIRIQNASSKNLLHLFPGEVLYMYGSAVNPTITRSLPSVRHNICRVISASYGMAASAQIYCDVEADIIF